MNGRAERARLAALRDRDRGAAMVEFALIAPILILLVMGIINSGWLFGQKLALNQAVREGARAAVVPATGASANIQQLVADAAPGVLSSGAVGASANLNCATTAGVGQRLTVTATYPAEVLVPMPIPGFDSLADLTSTAVFRCEF